MRWFRLNRVYGTQVALFALAIQFVLAFGHFHTLDTHKLKSATEAVGAAINTANVPTPAPADQPIDGLCAICVIVHLTSTAKVATPPVLLRPVTYVVAEMTLKSETTPDNPRCFEFRSRGPPQA